MSLEAIKTASAALGIMEHIENLINHLDLFKNNLTPTQQQELQVYIEKLKGIYTLLNEEDNLPVLLDSKIGERRRGFMSQVERLGLGSEIIRLTEQQRMTPAQIAEVCGISESSVTHFLNFYKKLKPNERSRYQRPSILNTTESLDTLGALIYKSLARLENSDNQDAFVKCLGELRQTIGMAAKIMEKFEARQEIERMKSIILEVLISELPEKRHEIIRKLGEVGLKYALPTHQP